MKVKLEKGVIIALIAAVSMALVNFSSAFSSREISPAVTIWFIWLTNAMLCLWFIVYRKKFVKFTKDCWKIKWLLLLMSLVATFAWFFYFIAITKRELSIITAITEAYPIMAISLGLWINKEKINWHQYLGMGLAIIGAVSLAFL